MIASSAVRQQKLGGPHERRKNGAMWIFAFGSKIDMV
jgi:hypothetical protein